MGAGTLSGALTGSWEPIVLAGLLCPVLIQGEVLELMVA